jgi:choline dehydrogenase
LGIPVIADSPVGHNLQDHVSSAIQFTLNETISLNSLEETNPWRLLQYYVTRSNKLTSNLAEGISFLKTKYANQNEDWPDIEFHMMTGIYR